MSPLTVFLLHTGASMDLVLRTVQCVSECPFVTLSSPPSLSLIFCTRSRNYTKETLPYQLRSIRPNPNRSNLVTSSESRCPRTGSPDHRLGPHSPVHLLPGHTFSGCHLHNPHIRDPTTSVKEVSVVSGSYSFVVYVLYFLY